MFVTVIIPFFNPSRKILETIKSVENFFVNTKFEILLIDDGSTNNISFLKEKQQNFKIIRQQHCGVSHARNVGINNAKGKYIMFCDSDDFLIGRLPNINYTQDIINFSINCKKEGVYSKKKHDLFWSSLFSFNANSNDFPGYYGGCVSKLFKTSFLRGNNILFDEKLNNSEDVLFNILAIDKAKSIYTKKKGIYKYIDRSTSVTHTFDGRLLENHIYLINKIKDLLSDIEAEKYLVKKIESLYLYQLVFRFFIYKRQNIIKDYLQWCRGIGFNDSKHIWMTSLNRLVERITIRLVNLFGIRSAVLFAQIYNYLKGIVELSYRKKYIVI